MGEAILLSCNISPEWFERNGGKDGPLKGSALLVEATRRYAEVMALIARRVPIPGLAYRTTPNRTTAVGFRLRSFRKWAEETYKWTFPVDFPKDPPETVIPLTLPHPVRAPVNDPAPTKGTWPWGDYETPQLGRLAAAAKHFWAAGHDPGSAPRKAQVVAWLRQNGSTKGEAEAIAQILRPVGIPPGPRKSYRPKKNG